MKKTEITKKISEETGMEIEKCEKVIKAFEEQTQDTLENKFKGIKDTEEDVISGISEKSGVATEDCKKIVKSLDKTLETALSNKLRFKK